MALRIYSNPLAITAQNSLTRSQSMLDQSIQRLSSGLRINSALDDASGLAVSKRLESQINGLSVANRNAQDGLSMLQVAEGGLQALGDMILRMRELSIQAANGTYTTSDRAELQKEVDQLKDEMNRVTVSVEFNTKKLLNGDATALWSSSSSRVEALITGEVKEGNYRIAVNTEPGSSAVYKSHIMQLAEGQFAAGLATQNGSLAYVRTLRDQDFSTNGGTYDINVSNTGAVTASTDNVSMYLAGRSIDVATSATVTPSAAAGSLVDRSGYFEYEVVTMSGNKTSGGASAVETIRYKFTDSKTGEVKSGTLDALASIVGKSSFEVTITGVSSFKINFSISSVSTTVPTLIEPGTKFLNTVQAEIAANADRLLTGGGVINIANNGSETGFAINGTPAGTASTPQVEYLPQELGMFDNNDGKDDLARVQLHYAIMDPSTGTVRYTAAEMYFNEITTAVGTIPGTSTYFINGGGEVATESTTLNQLASFRNANGLNIMDIVQTLTLYGGNGSKEEVFLEGNDTLFEVDDLLTNLLQKMGLGATRETAGSQAAADEINKNLVRFVTDLNKVGDIAKIPGTFIMQAAGLGANSRISVVGNSDIVDAFSFGSVINEAESRLFIDVYDAHTGKHQSSDSTTSGFLFPPNIQGVMLKVDSTAGLIASYNPNSGLIDYTSTGSKDNFYLHLVDNRTDLHIGANAGQTMSVSIPEMTIESLQLSGAYVYDQHVAEQAISLFDNALTRVNSTRATIGAQMSRITYTVSNLDIMRENLTAANSRVMDADIAAETTLFTRNQVLQQAATAMLAQAKALPQTALSLITS